MLFTSHETCYCCPYIPAASPDLLQWTVFHDLYHVTQAGSMPVFRRFGFLHLLLNTDGLCSTCVSTVCLLLIGVGDMIDVP